MVEKFETAEATMKSRLETWALALAQAYMSRSSYDGHRRCLDAHDVLTRIEKRIAHENKIRPRGSSLNRPTRPWGRRTDISDALSKAFPDDSFPGKLLRVHIYDKVEVGELTPNQGEDWARTFQWSRFAAWADEIMFDPEEAKLWSLGMAIKWVECVQSGSSPISFSEPLNHIDWLDGALRKVRQEWPEYIEQSVRWIKNREGGHSLLPKVFRGYRWVDPDAKQLLTNAMRSGKVQAVGIKSGVETRISPESWATFRIVGHKDVDGADRVVDATTNLAQARETHAKPYDSVYVNQRDLRSAFSPPSISAETQRYISPAEFECILKQEGARQGGKRIPQREAEDLLDRLGLRISRNTLRQVISKLWGAPRGRPRKSAE